MEKTKVLIVDDEPRVLESLRMHLSRDYSVLTTTSPKEALKALRRESFAVVISDLKMPEMSGVELLTQARMVSPRTTRVLLTGFASLQSAIAAINSGGVFRLLTKPSTPPEVKEVVEAAVEEFHVFSDQSLVDRHIDVVRKVSRVESLAEELERNLADMALHFSALVYSAADSKLSGQELKDLRWVEDRLHENAGRLSDVTTQEDSTVGVDLRRILCGQIDLWQRSGRLTSIRLRHKMDPVPRVVAREELIERAFLVLMDNAIEALQGHPKPRIEIKLYFCEFMEMVCMEIKNNGPPISPSIVNLVLSQPIPTANKRGESLYLLNEAVESVGGTMGRRQTDSGGTVFTIWLKPSEDSNQSMMFQPTESYSEAD